MTLLAKPVCKLRSDEAAASNNDDLHLEQLLRQAATIFRAKISSGRPKASRTLCSRPSCGHQDQYERDEQRGVDPAPVAALDGIDMGAVRRSFGRQLRLIRKGVFPC